MEHKLVQVLIILHLPSCLTREEYFTDVDTCTSSFHVAESAVVLLGGLRYGQQLPTFILAYYVEAGISELIEWACRNTLLDSIY